jgi:acetyl-CoA C-acetyltransferase
MSSGSISPRTPCIVGVAQHTVHPGPGVESPEPLELWEQVARAAATDTGRDTGGGDVWSHLDNLQVVYTQSWQYDDPPRRLADRLGASPARLSYSGIGGTTPQLLVGEAADCIVEGRSEMALVVGAEALETRRQLNKHGRRPEWSFRDPERRPFPFEAPFHPAEVAHGVFPAWLTFPVFDVARRAHLGVAPDDYRRSLGRLLSPMTEVAAANPFAWFRVARSADELIEATSSNRMVGYPYTKYMVSIMDVDMAAAVLVTSHGKADELGIPLDRRVYLRGWSYGTDVTYVAERHEMWRSPAMAAVSEHALGQAGVGVDDVAHLDLYSCFASSVNLARDALGLSDDDTRSLTVTGGLPFNGGAGSNYVLHSIAAMTEVLRSDPGSIGLVSGVGMHMTKHAYGVYSTTPAPSPPPAKSGAAAAARAEVKRRLDDLPTRPIRDTHTGTARVVAYTVAHGRDGAPEWGLVIGELAGGERCYGRVEGADVLSSIESIELVGKDVEMVSNDDKVNLVKV